jgi:hypothetical protein
MGAAAVLLDDRKVLVLALASGLAGGVVARCLDVCSRGLLPGGLVGLAVSIHVAGGNRKAGFARALTQARGGLRGTLAHGHRLFVRCHAELGLGWIFVHHRRLAGVAAGGPVVLRGRLGLIVVVPLLPRQLVVPGTAGSRCHGLSSSLRLSAAGLLRYRYNRQTDQTRNHNLDLHLVLL